MKQSVKIVFDRRGKAEKTGFGTIEISIYLSRDERRWESVGTATPDSWEVVAQNRNIVSKVRHYEQIINAMSMLGEEMTVDNFNNHIYAELAPKKDESKNMFNGYDQRQSFVRFCREHIEGENLRPNSLKGFRVVFDSVEASGILNTFADLTPANITAYDAWLHRQNNKTDYTIYGYHKKVHKYTKLLWRLEMIASDPYDHVKFNKGCNKERVPLLESDLIKMREANFTGHLDRVRDLFIFMAYTGLAYCDMAMFNYDTMTEEHSDYCYIDGSRMKTGSKFFTPILPPAMSVLKKYNYKLPIISNQKINDYCHIIQADLKINKSITCHIARHSFATLMLTYGISMEKVQRMLGHKNITTTQIYGKILKSNVERDVEMKLKTLR